MERSARFFARSEKIIPVCVISTTANGQTTDKELGRVIN